MPKSYRKGESVMEQEKKTCPFCGKQVDILYACSGCNGAVCVACHHLELAGSGCGTVIPLYYCPKCAFDEKINPNAGLKDSWE